ncbi:hypothetical protein TB1_016312 [Malus domestica]
MRENSNAIAIYTEDTIASRAFEIASKSKASGSLVTALCISLPVSFCKCESNSPHVLTIYPTVKNRETTTKFAVQRNDPIGQVSVMALQLAIWIGLSTRVNKFGQA